MKPMDKWKRHKNKPDLVIGFSKSIALKKFSLSLSHHGMINLKRVLYNTYNLGAMTIYILTISHI